MADIKQGVTYEIGAEDKASAVAKEAGKNAEQAFRPLEPIVAALHGNFEQAGQALLKMVASIKSVGMSLSVFTALTAALSLAVQAVRSIIGYFEDAKAAIRDISFDNAARSLATLSKEQETFNKLIEASRSKAENLKATLVDEANAIREMTKAQLEFNRAQELANAKDDDEKTAINRRYDDQSRSADRAASADIRAAERKRIETEIQILYRQIENSETSRSEYRDQAKSYERSARSARGKNTNRSMWSIWWNGSDLFEENNDTASRMDEYARTARAAEEKAVTDIAALNEKLEKARHDLEMLDIADETSARKEAAEDIAEMTKRANEDEAADTAAAEELLRIQEEYDRERAQEAVAIEEAARIAEEARIREIRLANEREIAAKRAELGAAAEEKAAAAARLSAAQAKVSQAWGWYRNKDSMAAQLEEEKANAAAEKQYEKDFERLSSKRNWRTAKNLTVDQEATRRVALAKEEEKAAEKNLDEITSNTGRIVEELQKLTEGIEA